MKYYTLKELNNIKFNNVKIIVENSSTDEYDEDTLFVEEKRTELNNHLETLTVKIINKEEISKIIDYLKTNNSITKDEMLTKLEINPEVNDSIFALIDKKIIVLKDGEYRLNQEKK